MTATNARLARRSILTIAAVGAVTIALVFLHQYAVSQYRHARDASASLASRTASAERARMIEPWNQEFVVTCAIIEAQRLLDAGDVDRAFRMLAPYATTVRGDALYRRTYQATASAKWSLDSRKAHVQHAKEATGGALAPEDVEK